MELEETSMEDGDGAENCAPQHSDEKKKKKRKRKPVLDLRFQEELEKSRGRLKRKERKKKYVFCYLFSNVEFKLPGMLMKLAGSV